MKIIGKEESREQCTEAGWYAYDYELGRALSGEDIMHFRELGADFICLSSMKHPFFKVEDTYYMIKGVEGKNMIRLSVYREYEEKICHRIERFVEEKV